MGGGKVFVFLPTLRCSVVRKLSSINPSISLLLRSILVFFFYFPPLNSPILSSNIFFRSRKGFSNPTPNDSPESRKSNHLRTCVGNITIAKLSATDLVIKGLQYHPCLPVKGKFILF